MASETVDGDLGEIGTVTPGRLKFRTTRQEEIEGRRWSVVNQVMNQFQRCGVYPMEIFQDKQNGLLFSQFQEDSHEAFQGLLSLPLWG